MIRLAGRKAVPKGVKGLEFLDKYKYLMNNDERAEFADIMSASRNGVHNPALGRRIREFIRDFKSKYLGFYKEG